MSFHIWVCGEVSLDGSKSIRSLSIAQGLNDAGIYFFLPLASGVLDAQTVFWERATALERKSCQVFSGRSVRSESLDIATGRGPTGGFRRSAESGERPAP